MTTEVLRYFLEVVRRGSISAAAESLFITPQGLGKSIRGLEEELGRPLFSRTPRGATLNEFGQYFRREAVAAMEAIESLKSCPEQYDRLTEKRLRVGVGFDDTRDMAEIIKKCTDFKELHPEMTLELVMQRPEENEHEVESGTMDVGLTVLPVDEARFCIVPLVRREMRLLVGRTHPLAGLESVSFEQIEHEKMILNNNKGYLYKLLSGVMGERFGDNVVYTSVTDRQLQFTIVEYGIGVSAVPEPWVGDIVAEHHGLLAIPFAPRQFCDLVFVTKKTGGRKTALELFLQYLEDDRRRTQPRRS